MAEVHAGGCLCGAVKYRVDGPLTKITYCHCGQCRRQTGLYYASTNAAVSDLTVVGEDNVTWYKSSEHGRRGFCRNCGSALFWKSEGAGHISMQVGTLDAPTGLVDGHHIYVADKGDFYEINDGLPQYAQGQPG
ncbi:GFA family protein [Rhizobium sp.]